MFEALEKELQRREKKLQSAELYHDSEEHKAFYRMCKDMPFYLWDYDQQQQKEHNELAKRTHGRCCYNHLIGLPKKHGVSHNLYEYEHKIFKELMKPRPAATASIVERQQHKHLACLKATGLGITEFVLRWISWMCVRNDDLKGQRVTIVTGPNVALAITLIKRMKELFLQNEDYPVVFEGKETEVIINGVEIRAYPSHHLDAMRGLTNVCIVFQDEAAFFELSQASDAVDVSHRYIAKSDPYLIVVSTPNRPGDMLAQITEQSEESCIYKRFYLPYTVGEGNIYSAKDIEIAKRSTSFEKEYNLKFLGEIGNVYLPQKVDEAIELGKKMDTYNQILQNPEITPHSQFYLGVDVGFGSSAFAIVLVMILDDVICVLETQEIFREQFDYCINEVASMMIKYGLNSSNTKVLVDASSPSVVSALKSQLNESTDYLPILERRKKMKVKDIYSGMTVIPIPFNTANKKQILLNVKTLLDSGLIALNAERHSNLILALRTATATDLILDKSRTVSNDVLDAFCLSCMRMTVNTEETQRYDIPRYPR
jgi:hypothetical protein